MNTNGARTKEWVGHSDRDGSHVQNMVKYQLVIHGESNQFLSSIQDQSVGVPTNLRKNQSDIENPNRASQ